MLDDDDDDEEKQFGILVRVSFFLFLTEVGIMRMRKEESLSCYVLNYLFPGIDDDNDE